MDFVLAWRAHCKRKKQQLTDICFNWALLCRSARTMSYKMRTLCRL